MRVALVVDDEQYSRYATVRALRTAGWDVRETSNGRDALALARERPDAIILDIKLPDLDGFEVCRRLKDDEATRRIPVIVKTAYFDETARHAARAAGADEFIVDSGDMTIVLAAAGRLTTP